MTPADTPQVVLQWAQAVESIAKTIALGFAGAWSYLVFVKNREKYPRAHVSHQITSWPMGEEGRVVHVAVTIENISKVLLRINGDCVTFHGITRYPVRFDMPHEPHLPLPHSEFETTKLGEHPVPTNWELEPGETDFIPLEIYVPYHFAYLKIYSHLCNATKTKRGIGWNRTTIHSLAQKSEYLGGTDEDVRQNAHEKSAGSQGTPPAGAGHAMARKERPRP